MGKIHKVKFNQGVHKSKVPLDYVHSDLWGPTRTQSKDGAKFFISNIDDYSKRVWLYPLRNKGQAFNKFVEGKCIVENQARSRLKKLRIYNGLEFYLNNFNNYYTKKGIQRHKTDVHNPQKNGVAKMMNITLLERVRSMLNGVSISKDFQAKAIHIAAYVVNKSPNNSIELKTLMERWTK